MIYYSNGSQGYSQWAQSASCTTKDGVLYYPNTWYGMQILLWTEEYVFFTYRKIIGYKHLLQDQDLSSVGFR
jgi:hypothetical protein